MSKQNEKADEELARIREKKLEELKHKLEYQEAQKAKRDTEGKVFDLNVLNFWELVNTYERVIIECWATWCRPCKAIEPILKKLAKIHTEVLFAKLDIDQSAIIAEQFQVQGVPTILFFKNGQLKDRLAGALPINEIEAHIRKFLA